MWNSLVKFIRLQNLLIVAAILYLLRHSLYLPLLEQSGRLSPFLDDGQFAIMVFGVALLTLAGNIINDIMDHEIDRINRPETVFVSRYITVGRAWRCYAALVVVSLGIFIYLCWLKDWWMPFGIPLFFTGLLAGYSTHFKKMPLVGNVVVGLSCAGLVPALAVTEWPRYAEMPQKQQLFFLGSYATYAFFAYYSTVFREIVKDMEDMEGDARQGCRTFPIIAGIPKSKRVAALHGWPLILMLTGLAYWLHVHSGWNGVGLLATYSIVLALFFAYLLFLLRKAENKAAFHRISSLSKWGMLGGLVALLLLWA